jgi:hypothetical protein
MPDGKQVLLGWVSDLIGVLFFDEEGELVSASEYPLGIDLRRGLGPVVEAIAAKRIRAVKRELGIRRGPIRVKPFFVKRWEVGLKLFPDDLEEFLSTPDRFSEDEAPIYWRDVEQWRADENCVLKWGNQYYLDREGNTI